PLQSPYGVVKHVTTVCHVSACHPVRLVTACLGNLLRADSLACCCLKQGWWGGVQCSDGRDGRGGDQAGCSDTRSYRWCVQGHPSIRLRAMHSSLPLVAFRGLGCHLLLITCVLPSPEPPLLPSLLPRLCCYLRNHHMTVPPGLFRYLRIHHLHTRRLVAKLSLQPLNFLLLSARRDNHLDHRNPSLPLDLPLLFPSFTPHPPTPRPSLPSISPHPTPLLTLPASPTLVSFAPPTVVSPPLLFLTTPRFPLPLASPLSISRGREDTSSGSSSWKVASLVCSRPNVHVPFARLRCTYRCPSLSLAACLTARAMCFGII
ncbi:unnamed protein product, partial [Closterium sp. Naga37s-1]